MSRLIERLLIPTDDSDGAIAGARRGIALASRTGSEVHVLSVVETDAAGPSELDDVTAEALEARAEETVERVADMVREYDPDLGVRTTVKRGTPFQTIREYANRREIDVIAMGTKGRTGIDRLLLGSVTENVLRTARTPVLAVPPNAEDAAVDDAVEDVAFDDLLLPTDGSDGAAIATEWGIALAETLDSRVHALYSVDTSPFSQVREPGDVIGALEDRGDRAVGKVRELATDTGVSVSSSIATGSPANVILSYAADHGIDVIVMGTHGRTGVGQWFLGSATENVVRGGEVPVFCVPVSAESP